MGHKHAMIEHMTSFLKERGYKKRTQNWRKDCEEVSLAFSIQSSQYDRETFYLCFGVTVSVAYAVNGFNATTFPIQERIDGDKVTFKQAEYAIELWERKYGTLEKLVAAAVENTLPLFSNKLLVSFLRSEAWRILH